MAREGLSLPLSLLREIGVDEPSNDPSRRNATRRVSRKDRRRAERAAKRSSHRVPEPKGLVGPAARGDQRGRDGNDDRRRRAVATARGERRRKNEPPPKSVLKRKRQCESGSAQGSMASAEEHRSGLDDDDYFHDSEGGEGGDHDDESGLEEPPRHSKVPKTVRDKLAQDDAEIAELERKLGLKKGRKGVLNSFQEDGLGDLLQDIDDIFDDEALVKKKRKAAADEWLAQKRRKASTTSIKDKADADQEFDELDGGVDHMEDSDSLDLDGDENDNGDEAEDDTGSGLDQDNLDDDDEFEGFESGTDDPPTNQQQQSRIRENPYVAPTTSTTAGKYVPPSQRVQTGSDAELAQRIQRQTKGLVNRLTEANMISLLGDIEMLYVEHPRQHVTSTLVDLLLVQVCDPSTLSDTLLILTAGFATAVYKIVGMDFGAYLVQRTVERFKECYERAVARSREQLEVTKESSNLITFISELYSFQLIGCNLIFDHIRLLLQELMELNAELLLRIIRMCGTSLRQDDPMALKDIVALIRPAMDKAGEKNISVRTKFMVETINDLKNNKVKTGASVSAVVTERTIRMKKLLGSLNARKLRATEPLRMGLRDIEESDKRGKWWLVGSSWAGAAKVSAEKDGNNGVDHVSESELDDADDFDITVGAVGGGTTDVSVLAREQMMNTDVRRSIFVAVMSATDCEDAYHRLLKLKLNKDRQREVPNVLIRCVGSERQYNPYYSLIARRLCSDRKVRWAFQDALWKLFRRLGESIFGEATDDWVDDDDESMELRRIVNVAKMYGDLVAEGALSLQILKCLNLVYLRAKTKAFVEVMLITAILGAHSKAKTSNKNKGKNESADNNGGEDAAVKRIFKVSGDVTDLVRGLQYFLRKILRKSDLAGGRTNTKIVRHVCRVAENTLEAALADEEDAAGSTGLT